MSNERFYDAIFPHFWETLDQRAFVSDPQGMLSDEGVFQWIIQILQPKEIIEIGSWKGHSANFMIDLCKAASLQSRMVCVDTFLGGPEHWVLPGAIDTLHRVNGRPTILERFLGNVVARGHAGSIFPLTADSNSAAEIFRQFGFRADLIFVDAGHDPISVRSDIMLYKNLLSESGVMFGDDYDFEPLAVTVHECARELGLQVLVSARKWIFCNEALLKRVMLPNIQLRSSHEGWRFS